MLSKADLLKPKITTVNIDGGTLTIRAMSAAYAMGLQGKDIKGVEIFQIIADSIIQDDGNPMLTADEVGTLAIATITQITKAVFEFNALGAKAIEDATAELKKTDVLTTNSVHS